MHTCVEDRGQSGESLPPFIRQSLTVSATQAGQQASRALLSLSAFPVLDWRHTLLAVPGFFSFKHVSLEIKLKFSVFYNA